MDHFTYILLIAFANNVDNVGARIAYSLRGVRIGHLVNLWISVLTFIITSAACGSGSKLSGVIGRHASSTIAMVLLVGIGIWMLREPYRLSKKAPLESAPQR